MKILHLCLQGAYTDNWGYQDNILPKSHVELGHDVTVLTIDKSYDSKGLIIQDDRKNYTLDNGIKIIRISKKDYWPHKLNNIIKYYKIYDILKEINPDFIMVHGVNNISVIQIIKFLKKVNRNCKVVADNHTDYYNGKLKNTLRNNAYFTLFILLNKVMKHYYSTYFGVTPWRVDYLINIFKIPQNKCELLVMGGDDEKIRFNDIKNIKSEIRNNQNIGEEDFVIVTGGKINKDRKIIELVKAIERIDDKNLKLIIFGTPDNEVQEEFYNIIKNDNIKYLGWIEADKAYDYFLTSDLCCFPGTHSVLWEQACACGIPGIFKDWEGMHHVDVGGNCVFLKDESIETLENTIKEIYLDKEKYQQMKRNAVEKGIKTFSYREIAKKAIGIE